MEVHRGWMQLLKNKTIEQVHKSILDNISNDYDKTVGYLTHDVTKAFAIEEHGLFEDANELYLKTDIENLEGQELETFIYQRKGIERKQATKAIGVLEVTGTGKINAGALFQTEAGTQFKATETKQITTSGTVNIEAVLPGTVGNVGSNTIKKIPVTISGITAVNNPSPTSGGYEAETDQSLLERYYLALRTPPTSGNKYHYLMWAKEVEGVGDAKVYPLERGANTVGVVIIDEEKTPAEHDLIEKVQNYIDPGSTGTGEGQAPIGARCYVASATEKQITVSVTLSVVHGYDKRNVKLTIEENIKNHLKEIAFKESYVSYAKIGSIILNTVGVKDYSSLTVNDGSINVEIADKEVATLGGVTVV